jgi:hypothetical protein
VAKITVQFLCLVKRLEDIVCVYALSGTVKNYSDIQEISPYFETRMYHKILPWING